jgi:uncharacterized protein
MFSYIFSSLKTKYRAVNIFQFKTGFVSDVNEVVKLHQHVTVKVVEVDEDRKRIQLTMVI